VLKIKHYAQEHLQHIKTKQNKKQKKKKHTLFLLYPTDVVIPYVATPSNCDEEKET
jgi:hypothetical protein